MKNWLSPSPHQTLRRWIALSGAGFGLLLAGCGASDHDEGLKHEHEASEAAGHEHHAPHDGAAVVLGDEAYHLEFVLDPDTSTLTAYVLDGELEQFVRIAAAGFEVKATVAGETRTLQFVAVDNPATGETVGDTAQFEATSPWLKTATAFDAKLTTLNVRGTTFADVVFNFPHGNETADAAHAGHEH